MRRAMPSDAMTDDYRPISCDFHDVLEIRAMKKEHCAVEFIGDDGKKRLVVAAITDVFAKDGEEFLTLDSNETVRLDRIVSVDGVRLSDFC